MFMAVLYELIMETSLCIYIDQEITTETGIFSLPSCLFFTETKPRIGTLWIKMDLESKQVLKRNFIFNSGEKRELTNQEALNIAYHSLRKGVKNI